MAFDAKINGRDLHFGVSGLLYNSDVLMYDRETNSLCSQVFAKAFSGEMKGETLKMLPLKHTTWKNWKTRHPNTLLLSFDTGYNRDYQQSLYAGYSDNDSLYFSVNHEDKRYHPKEVVIGIEVDGCYKAYPMMELSQSNTPLFDTVNSKAIVIHFDSTSSSGRIEDSQGEPLPSLTAYWFAWFTFHPETAVFSGELEQ